MIVLVAVLVERSVNVKVTSLVLVIRTEVVVYAITVSVTVSGSAVIVVAGKLVLVDVEQDVILVGVVLPKTWSWNRNMHKKAPSHRIIIFNAPANLHPITNHSLEIALSMETV